MRTAHQVSSPPPHPEIHSHVVNHLDTLSDRHLLARYRRVRIAAALAGALLCAGLALTGVSLLPGNFVAEACVGTVVAAVFGALGAAQLSRMWCRLDRRPSDAYALALCGPQYLPAWMWNEPRWAARLRVHCRPEEAAGEIADALAGEFPGTVAELLTDAERLVHP